MNCAGGKPSVVMSIVFAGAPVVNAVVALAMHPPAGGWGGLRWQFVAGILVCQLDSPHATRPETVEWLLEVCDSTPIYRARYAGLPRLAQMLNLLLYDAGHPMALAFHRRSIDRDLDDLARRLGGERERGIVDMPLLPAGSAELLDAAGAEGEAARRQLAAELRGLAASAADLSDRLSRRYFALIDSDAHALAT